MKKVPWTVILLALGNFVSLLLRNLLNVDLSEQISTIVEGGSLIAAGILQIIQMVALHRKKLSIGLSGGILVLLCFSLHGCLTVRGYAEGVQVEALSGRVSRRLELEQTKNIFSERKNVLPLVFSRQKE